jgi:hypothetical protein
MYAELDKLLDGGEVSDELYDAARRRFNPQAQESDDRIVTADAGSNERLRPREKKLQLDKERLSGDHAAPEPGDVADPSGDRALLSLMCSGFHGTNGRACPAIVVYSFELSIKPISISVFPMCGVNRARYGTKPPRGW